MKIVWLTPELPYPANTGGRIVVYNRLKQFYKAGNEIRLIAIADDIDEVNNKDLEKICNEVTVFNRGRHKLSNLIKSVKKPYCVASRTFGKINKIIKKYVADGKCEVIICEFPQMTANIMGLKKGNNVRCVLSLHNIESDSMASLASGMPKGMKRRIYAFEAMRLRKLEDKIASSGIFDAVCFVSENDMDIFKSRYTSFNGDLWISPIGADRHQISEKAAGNNIICVGKMNYSPNISGVKWLATKVMPRVLEEYSDAVLYIVGKDPADEVKNLANEHVIVTGTVDSVEIYYKNASVAALPIFNGGGVKTKLIEASSYGVPIVSTTFGVLGTVFGSEEEIILADSETDFAEGIVRCLRNPEATKKMAEIATKKFGHYYTWDGICRHLNYKIVQLCKS